jgi:hypothetical protein
MKIFKFDIEFIFETCLSVRKVFLDRVKIESMDKYELH